VPADQTRSLAVPLEDKLPNIDKPKRMQIRGKLAAAIDAMVFEGLQMDQAALRVKCSTRAIRKAFERPHVLSHIRKRKEVLRVAISSKNIIRLGQIRDAADNMPAVNAIKTLEELGSIEHIARSSNNASPGIVIRIMTGADTASAMDKTVIDVTPNKGHSTEDE
jgi:hypothetical protein